MGTARSNAQDLYVDFHRRVLPPVLSAEDAEYMLRLAQETLSRIRRDIRDPNFPHGHSGAYGKALRQAVVACNNVMGWLGTQDGTRGSTWK